MSTIRNLGDYLKRNKRHSIWHKIATFCAAVVVFSTTYALILPAITMTHDDVFCGLEEHAHAEACRMLVCTVPESAPHFHTVECCDPAKLICGDPAHTHGVACYAANSFLCGKQEDHVHGDTCYAIHRKLDCGQTEQEAHAHTEACFAEQQVLSCGLSEIPAHDHSDACYTIEEKTVCGLEDDPEHVHGEGCVSSERVLSCGKEETNGHAHTDACYQTEQVNVCGLTESEGHAHSEACFKNNRELTCQIPEPVHHSHGKDCYKYVCGKEEHQHSLVCYSNPDADVETEADWTRNLPKDQKLTGKWNEDVLAVAVTQLGYTESTSNYRVVEDNVMKGYTRYGAWYGDPYGDWDAMFVSFCLHYAGVDSKMLPLDSDCGHWLVNLQEPVYKCFRSADAYSPVPGDLIFFEGKNEGIAAHVALIAELVCDEEGTLQKYKVIEGDSENSVRYETYDADDRTVMGFCEIPANPDYVPPEEETVPAEPVVKTFEGADYIVTVTYTEEAGIPEEAELKAEEYAKDSEVYQTRYAEAAELYGWNAAEDYSNSFRLFNIGLFVDGEEIEPAAEIKVTVTYKNILTNGSEQCKVTHYGDEIETVEAESSCEKGTAVIDFSAGSFSDYGIMLMAAAKAAPRAVDPTDLIASFDFTDRLDRTKDSTGNARATVIGTEDFWDLSGVGSAIRLDGSTYMTITAEDGSSLLTGYDEVSVEFWMLLDGSTGANWPFYAAPNGDAQIGRSERYIGILANSNGTTVERYLCGDGVGRQPAAHDGKTVIADNGEGGTTGTRVHVRADYYSDGVYLTVTGEDGSTSGPIKADNTVDLQSVLGSDSIIQIGKANWGSGEYYHGFISDLHIYGRKNQSDAERNRPLIAHASFNDAHDGTEAISREETGYAQIDISHLDNEHPLGYSSVAPGAVPEGHDKRSLQLESSKNEYIEINGLDGSDLIKGQADITEFTVDLWAKPAPKGEGDASDYGLFNIGGQRSVVAKIPAATPNLLRVSIAGGSGKSVDIDCGESMINKMVNIRVDYHSNGKVNIFVLDEQGAVLGSGVVDARMSVETLFGTGTEHLEFGRDNQGQYFNGILDEIKFLSEIPAEPTTNIPDRTEGQEYMVAYATFDSDGSLNDQGQQNGPTMHEMTGNAKVQGYKGENAVQPWEMAYGNYTVIPNDDGFIDGSLNLRAENSEHISFVPSSTNSSKTLLKNQGFDTMELDFWVYPRTGGTMPYGLFDVGGDTNELTATIQTDDDGKSVVALSVKGGTGNTIRISTDQPMMDNWLNVQVRLENDGTATLLLKNRSGNTVGSGSMPVGLALDQLFSGTEHITFGEASGANNYNGILDEVKIRAWDNPAPTPGPDVADGTKWPTGAQTKDLKVSGVYLFNINTAGGSGTPLAGVKYTAVNVDNPADAHDYYTDNEYLLRLDHLTPGCTYAVSQTGVPSTAETAYQNYEYVVASQTKEITIPANAATTDSLIEVGVFFDYLNGEGYEPQKTAECIDYENRVYDVEISAKSGALTPAIASKNFNFVVDQSNSMLFPSRLIPTGKTVDLHYLNDGNDSTTEDASGNSARLDALNLDTNKVYYIIALPETKATVYAIWKSTNGLWYYQDAAYYSYAQRDAGNPNRTYLHADEQTQNNTQPVNSGGCLNGVNRTGQAETAHGNKGYLLTGDFVEDLTTNGTATGLEIQFGTAQNPHMDFVKNYQVYEAYYDPDLRAYADRLTYLKYAIKRMLYQLAAMGSDNTVTISTFDSKLESCMTQNVDLSDKTGLNALLDFVSNIKTGGGTAQNFGLWHVLGEMAVTGDNPCGGGHLSDHSQNYVMMITDGALNAKNQAHLSGYTQEADLLAAGQQIRGYRDTKLITIGLSVQNVTWAQTLLDDVDGGGIASPGMDYLDIDANQLSETLSNKLLAELLSFTPRNDYATIRDYISDSFYLVDENNQPLKQGDHVTLEGVKAEGGIGVVGFDNETNRWYVEWPTQVLPLDSRWEAKLRIKAREDFIGGNSIDTNKASTWDKGLTISLHLITQDGLQFKPNGDPIFSGVIADVKTPTVNVRLLSMNQLNSEETVFLGDEVAVREKLENFFKALRFDKILSFEEYKTIYAAELTGMDEAQQKAKFDAQFGTTVYNHTPASGAPGLDGGSFSLYYAMMMNRSGEEQTDLLNAIWNALKNGQSYTVPYTYDQESSHGPVGAFVISLVKTGSETAENHSAAQTGPDVETYTLRIVYNAYRIDPNKPEDSEDSTTRYPTVSTCPEGTPGTEVGSVSERDLTKGYGTLTSENLHKVSVVDGKIKIVKTVTKELAGDLPQTFTFTLTKLDAAEGEKSTWPVTITVPAASEDNAESITVESDWIEDLPRGQYRITETVDANGVYFVSETNVVAADTNCLAVTDADTGSTAFYIGTDMSRTDAQYSAGDGKTEEELNALVTANNVIEPVTGDGYRPVYSKYYKDGVLNKQQPDTYKGVSHGALEIVNDKTSYTGEISVTKAWRGSDSSDSTVYDHLTVYIALYDQNGEPVRDADQHVLAVKLNKSNGWSGTFEVPLTGKLDTVEAHHYTVRELSGVGTKDAALEAVVINDDDAVIKYLKDAADGEFAAIGERAFVVHIVEQIPQDGEDDEGGEDEDAPMKYGFTVTNAEAYKLPESGGMGTTLFTSVGLFLTLGSALGLGKKSRHRRGDADDQ